MFGQSNAIDVLHGDERCAVPLTDFVDLADVGMVDARGHLSFAQEALTANRIFLQRDRQNLECEFAPQLEVFGQINLSHPAVPQFAVDAVMRELVASRHQVRDPNCYLLLPAAATMTTTQKSAPVSVVGGNSTPILSRNASWSS